MKLCGQWDPLLIFVFNLGGPSIFGNTVPAMEQSGNNSVKSKTQVYELSKAMEDTIKRIQVFYIISASASPGY